LLLSVSVASVDLDCPLLLKKHSKFDGVGVYAGRDYKAGEVVERCVTVSIPRSKSNPLTDMYVFSHTPEYTDLVLGYGMIYNSNANHSLRMHSSLRPSARVAVGTPEGPPPLLDFYITAHYDIPKGQEMFTDYGGAPWFEEKGIPFLAAPEEDAGVLLPGCASGKAEIIRGRVYATQLIQPGEVVEVARALVLPGSMGDGSMLERLMWFRKDWQENAMLVLGYGALYEGAEPGTANLHYGWHSHEAGKCEDVMLVEFVATRLIEPNEALSVPMVGVGATGRRYVQEQLFSDFCF